MAQNRSLAVDSPVPSSSRRVRWGVAAAVALLVVGAAGGLFGWLRYQNERKMISSLTTIEIEGTEYTGIDDMTTAPDGTLYVLTGSGDHLDPHDIAILRVDAATGASQPLPVPPDAYPSSRLLSARSLAVGSDGSVFTGSHLWNPHTGSVQHVTSEKVNQAAIDASGRLVYTVSVEDENNNYRATTSVYRTSGGSEPRILATIPGTAEGITIDPNSRVLLHIDPSIGWGEDAKILRISDDGGLEPVQVDDIYSNSYIAFDDVGRLVYVCADQHAMCSRELGDTSSTRLEFTTVRPMWTSDEAVRVSGFDAFTWLPEGKALVNTYVRGREVVVVARP